MNLAKLVRALEPVEPQVVLNGALPFDQIEITSVTDKSSHVVTGALFVAYRGVNVDGAQFVPDAIERGATAIVTESTLTHPISPSVDRPLAVIRVTNGRAALAHLAAAWHHSPSRNLRVIGVTGTDGKTTTCTLIENILLAAGHTVGTVTTVAAHVGGREVDTGFHTTTPDAPEIQKYLADMVEGGTEYAVIEATSHGLAQHRLDSIAFDIAVVTNITHEHLDIHGSWENYRDAKVRLFYALTSTPHKPRTKKVAVLNADDNELGVFDTLRAIPADERVIYGTGKNVQSASGELWITPGEIQHSKSGLKFVVTTPFGELDVESPLIGRYNVSNVLAACGAALGRRIPFDAIAQGIRFTRGVVGRMERVEVPEFKGEFDVIVDFAHTPNSLSQALKTGRELASGRVIAMFGCAGLRDVQKRSWMGQTAGQLADVTIITAEDPRTESLAAINGQIADGVRSAGRVLDSDYFIVEDRGAAIDFAVNELARPGDIVLLCGKGHERSMCFGTTEYPWSDQDAARSALVKYQEQRSKAS